MKTFKLTIVAFITALALLWSSPWLQRPTIAQLPPIAQTATPISSKTLQGAIERLFTTSAPIPAEWFTDEFLAKVPIIKIRQIVASLQQQLGSYQSVQPDGDSFLIIFANAAVPTKIAVNSNGQIYALLFQSPRLAATNLNQVVDQFKTLPGNVGLLVVEDKTVRAALNETTPLGVGSAFKLAVLNTLKSQISQGRYAWNQVIKLDERARSMPSGLLQDWHPGSSVTLETLASLMISISDNTATDHLIRLLGRETVEMNTTARNRPFLLTRDLFLLKSTKNTALLAEYRNGNEAQRRAVLKRLETFPTPKVEDFPTTPTALDIEWFFTPQELCSLMATVEDLPLMSINPGIANAADWKRVAFKGGSEPGVLSLTTAMTAKNNQHYCVSAIWNRESPLNEEQFFTLYRGLIEVLKATT